MLDETTGVVAAVAALIVLIERIMARISEHRAQRNGSRQARKSDIDHIDRRVAGYVQQNAHEHRELHDKIDGVRGSVEYIRGKMDGHNHIV